MNEVSKELKIALKADARGAETLRKEIANINKEAGELGKIMNQVNVTSGRDGGFGSLSKVMVKHAEELKKMGVLTKETMKVFEDFNKKAIQQQISDLSELDKKLKLNMEALDRWKKKLSESNDEASKTKYGQLVSARERDVMNLTVQRAGGMQQAGMLGSAEGGGALAGLAPMLARALGVAGTVWAGAKLADTAHQAYNTWQIHAATNPLISRVREQQYAATAGRMLGSEGIGYFAAMGDPSIAEEFDRSTSTDTLRDQLLKRQGGLIGGLRLWNRDVRLTSSARVWQGQREHLGDDAIDEYIKQLRSGKDPVEAAKEIERLGYGSIAYRYDLDSVIEAEREWRASRSQQVSDAMELVANARKTHTELLGGFASNAPSIVAQNRMFGGDWKLRHHYMGALGESERLAISMGLRNIGGGVLGNDIASAEAAGGLMRFGVSSGAATSLVGSLALGARGDTSKVEEQTAKIMGEAFAKGLSDSGFLEDLAVAIANSNRTSSGLSVDDGSLSARLSAITMGIGGTKYHLQSTLSAHQSLDAKFASGGQDPLTRALNWEAMNEVFQGTPLANDHILKMSLNTIGSTDLVKGAQDMSLLDRDHKLWAILEESGMSIEDFQDILGNLHGAKGVNQVLPGLIFDPSTAGIFQAASSGDHQGALRMAQGNRRARLMLQNTLGDGDWTRSNAALGLLALGTDAPAVGSTHDLGLDAGGAATDHISRQAMMEVNRSMAEFTQYAKEGSAAIERQAEKQRELYEQINLTTNAIQTLSEAIARAFSMEEIYRRNPGGIFVSPNIGQR